MIQHHEGIILQKGYEPLEAISLKEQTSTRAVFLSLAGDFEISCYSSGIFRMRLIMEHGQPDYGILSAGAENLPLKVTAIPGGYWVES